MVLWVCVIKPPGVLSLKLDFREAIIQGMTKIWESPQTLEHRDSYQALKARLKRHCSPEEGWTGCLTWAILKIMRHFLFFLEVSDEIELNELVHVLFIIRGCIS